MLEPSCCTLGRPLLLPPELLGAPLLLVCCGPGPSLDERSLLLWRDGQPPPLLSDIPEAEPEADVRPRIPPEEELDHAEPDSDDKLSGELTGPSVGTV